MNSHTSTSLPSARVVQWHSSIGGRAYTNTRLSSVSVDGPCFEFTPVRVPWSDRPAVPFLVENGIFSLGDDDIIFRGDVMMFLIRAHNQGPIRFDQPSAEALELRDTIDRIISGCDCDNHGFPLTPRPSHAFPLLVNLPPSSPRLSPFLELPPLEDLTPITPARVDTPFPVIIGLPPSFPRIPSLHEHLPNDSTISISSTRVNSTSSTPDHDDDLPALEAISEIPSTRSSPGFVIIEPLPSSNFTAGKRRADDEDEGEGSGQSKKLNNTDLGQYRYFIPLYSNLKGLPRIRT